MIGDARVGVDGRKIHAGDVDLHGSIYWRVNRPATSNKALWQSPWRVRSRTTAQQATTIIVERSSAYA